jgi:hypothetical protein
LPAVSAQTLRILNNFTIIAGNDIEFDANDNDVEIGREFKIEDGAIYTTGDNTTRFFSGPADRIEGDDTDRSRIIIENTADPAPVSFNNLSIEMDDVSYDDDYTVEIQSSGRTTTEGDANNYVFSVLGDLTISSKNTLNYNSFSINVQGDITCDGRMGSSGRRTRLNGTTDQNITNSENNGIRQTLEINKASGIVYLKNDDEFDLRLTAGIFDISTYEFSTDGKIEVADGDADDVSDFDNTMMIRTTGLSSDGGYKLRFEDASTNDTYIFPVGIFDGSSNIYTPVEIILTADPVGQINGSDNYFSVVPVKTYHPGTDDDTKVIHYYWKTDTTGFTSITNSYSIEYNFYADASITNTGDNQDAQFLLNNTWINENGNTYDKNNYIATFTKNALGDIGFEKADFTAGNNSVFNSLDVLYSRNATSGGDWRTLATWSESGHDGSALNNAGQLPIAGDFVVIAEGHTVTIADNTQASEDITLSGTLDVGTTTGHTFGTISGNGTFRIEGSTLPTANFQPFTEVNSSVFEYYGDGSAYTLPSSITEYYDLDLSGSAVKTLPAVDFEVRRRLYIRSSSSEVYLNNAAGGDFEVTKNLRIDGNSQLIFQNSGTARDVTLNNNLRLQDNGASVKVQAAGTANITHTITTTGDLQVNDAGASFDFYDIDGTDTYENVIDVTLTGSDERDIGVTGIGFGELHRLIVNTGTSQSVNVNLYNIELKGETDGSSKALELQNGTVTIINDLAPYTTTPIVLSSGNDDFTIPSTTALVVNTGRVTVTGANTGISLAGKLRVENEGELWLDDGTNNNYIEYGAAPELEIADNGELIVGSQIRRQTSVETGALKYTQTGGTLIVGKNAVPTTTRGVFEVLNVVSRFNFYNGNITIVQGHSGTISDFYLDPTSSICEGTINIGNDDSPSGTITIESTADLYALSTGGTDVIAQAENSLTFNSDVSIAGNTEFDANNYDIVIKGDFSNIGTYTSGTNTTTFSGAIQTLDGETTFNNLTISSSSSFTINSSSDIGVLGNFTNSSSLNNGGSDIDVDGNITNSGTVTGTGAFIASGTNAQTITGGSFYDLQINNTSVSGVSTSGDMTITGTLTMTSGLFDIDVNELYLENNPVISGTPFSSSKMVTTSGDISNKGLKLGIPSGTDSYNIPIGAGNNFSNIDIDISGATTAGTITIVPVNAPHPTATDPDKVLQFYWKLSYSGLSNMDSDLDFHYEDADIRGTEADYLSSHLVGTHWSKYAINAGSNIAEFRNVSDLSGEYTAGEDPDGIPDDVPVYTSTGTTNDWTLASSWSGTPAVTDGVGPSGAVAIIQDGHTINLNQNNITNYKTQVNGTGTLYVDGTIAHNIGIIEGTGTIEVVDVGSLPSGNYSDFVATSGGTLDFGGTTDYSISGTYTDFNNLTFSGNGQRNIPSGPITISGNIDIQGTVTVNNSAYNSRIILLGNITKSAGSDFNSGTNEAVVEFSGTATQTINGAGFTGTSDDFHKIKIDNSNGVTLNCAIDVNDEIIFSSGLIENSDTYTLTMNSGATYSGLSNSSFINGPVDAVLTINGSTTFPTGNTDVAQEIGVINSSLATTWTAEYLGTNANETISASDSELDKVSIVDRWFLGTADHPTAKVQLFWNSNSGVGDDDTQYQYLRVAMEDGATEWVSQGQSVHSGTTSSYGSVTSNDVSFSDHIFTIASTVPDLPLPVELISFEAKQQELSVIVEWATAAELNNDYFLIERSSDANTFEEIGRVSGNGNSSFTNYYEFEDNYPLEGVNYYRLKQVDYDFNFEYSKIIAVTYNEALTFGEKKDFTVFPNPYNFGDLNLILHHFNSNEPLSISFTNVFGEQAIRINLDNLDDNSIKLNSYFYDQLKAGIYIISVETDKEKISKRIMIK